MLAVWYHTKSVGSGIQVTSHLVAAFVVILVCGIFAQGKGSSDLMIPPRHRPYFERKHSQPQYAGVPTNDVRNSLYREASTKDVSQAVSFVDKKLFYNGHVMSRRNAMDDSEASKCKAFEVGNPERGEFYSPSYPDNYPNNIECTKLLEAEPGHLLKLDFRNKFDLEYSKNCTYDFLEVRDGQHGYDQLKHKFCGNTFPDIIESSSRYLWLRFKSDDSIEGAGFTAVYESVLPEPGGKLVEMPACKIYSDGYEGWLNTSYINPSYLDKTSQLTRPIDCMWTVNVTEGWKIQLVFKTFNLFKPNDCQKNFVDIFSPTTDVKSRVKTFCGAIADVVNSENNILYVRFFADSDARNSTFSSLFTAYREAKKNDENDGRCKSDEFDCQDERCIKKELECNGNENCRFRWDDDEHCIPQTGTLAETLKKDHVIIILVIFCLILSGMCFTFLFNCVRKLIHDHSIIQDSVIATRLTGWMLSGSSASSPEMFSFAACFLIKIIASNPLQALL
ncbi:neuropilin and tolloid-like protein 2 isoform X3 [Zootermopsis nevadensis]|uniref:neuropilin and tolloid-like protein 2 isoform X3 n=1 Tax=Zootermopsis nevadensis TaxID=136037 RepID=UPI000B8EAD61|nr:neuropilin and tolloid-like protein 2 isoform X3 [Zootermopsis nevadensis]